MKAVVLDGAGDVSVLKVRSDVPQPAVGPSDLLVRIHATAINRADVMQRRGHYPAPPGAVADILGLEYAGEVEATGPAVREFAVGDRVFGLAKGGTYAQYVAVHERTAARIPDGIDFETAAAVPEAFTTAHDAMFRLGGFAMGHTLFVQAVGSSVGLAGVQMAKASGGFCIGTSRTPSKLERAQQEGCDLTLLDDDKTVERTVAYTKGRGVDVVFNFIGPSKYASDLAIVRVEGRIIQIGMLGGSSAQVDLRAMGGKRASIIGTALRSRPLEESIAAAREFAAGVVPLLGTKLRPIIDSVYDLDDVAAAHTRVEKNENFGKVVLRVS
jgi:NADPH:quinone reductase